MLNNIDGAGINGLQYFYDGSNGFMANSPYDCCAACIATEGCGASIYYGNGQCMTFSHGQCDPTNQVATALFNSDYPSEETVMNSNCGSFNIIQNQ